MSLRENTIGKTIENNNNWAIFCVYVYACEFVQISTKSETHYSYSTSDIIIIVHKMYKNKKNKIIIELHWKLFSLY